MSIQQNLIHLLLTITLLSLSSCAGGGADESKDGDSISESTATCTVGVDGNFIINNNTGNIFFDLGACEADKPNEGKTCNDCDDDYDECVNFGEAEDGTTDEECLEIYQECQDEASCN